MEASIVGTIAVDDNENEKGCRNVHVVENWVVFIM